MLEDLTLFFDQAEFAQDAVWSAQPDNPVVVIFDNQYLETLGVSTSNPQATAIAAHMPNVARGQTLTINSVVYKIDDIQPDGTGLILLQLTK